MTRAKSVLFVSGVLCLVGSMAACTDWFDSNLPPAPVAPVDASKPSDASGDGGTADAPVADAPVDQQTADTAPPVDASDAGEDTGTGTDAEADASDASDAADADGG